jgi:uncharacterized damage-inducible protein DinB
MRKTWRTASAAAAALLLAGVLVHPVPARAQAAAKDAKAGTSVQAEILKQIDAARDKLLALAEATPADKFTWRPNDKVRTVGEIYGHVAATNYFLPTLWGVKPPEGVDPRGFEKEGGDKAKTIDTLKKSFEHVHEVIGATTDADLHKTIKIFGHDGTVLEGLMILSSHGHEHLGQSIAYARSLGIVPPWSR